MIIQISPNEWVNVRELESIEIRSNSDNKFYLVIKDAMKIYSYHSAAFCNQAIARSFAKSIVAKLNG